MKGLCIAAQFTRQGAQIVSLEIPREARICIGAWYELIEFKSNTDAVREIADASLACKEIALGSDSFTGDQLGELAKNARKILNGIASITGAKL